MNKLDATLVFPAGMPRSLQFLEFCKREGRRVVGASSLAYDPSRVLYDEWIRLPYVRDEHFLEELLKFANEYSVKYIFSPHPVVWSFLNREFHLGLGKLQLINESPATVELLPYRAALERSRSLMRSPLELQSSVIPRTRISESQVASLILHTEHIPGMCDNEKVRALCEIAIHSPEGDLVEIGSWWGKSAFVFLALAQFYGIGPLLCVDPWSDAHLIQSDDEGLVDSVSAEFSSDEAFGVFKMNLLPYAKGDVNYLRMPSVEGAAYYKSGQVVASETFGVTSYSGKISVLHIDGNHSYTNASYDILLWAPMIVPGGWLIVDDYRWPFGDGPKRVGDEFLANNKERVSCAFVMGGALFIQLR